MKITFINGKTYTIHEVENMILELERIRAEAYLLEKNSRSKQNEYKLSLKEDMSPKEDENNS